MTAYGSVAVAPAFTFLPPAPPVVTGHSRAATRQSSRFPVSTTLIVSQTLITIVGSHVASAPTARARPVVGSRQAGRVGKTLQNGGLGVFRK